MKVRCIDDSFRDDPANPFKISDIELPKKGETYTIREVVPTKYGTGVRLTEIQNKKYFYSDIGHHQEPIFGDYRFEQASS